MSFNTNTGKAKITLTSKSCEMLGILSKYMNNLGISVSINPTKIGPRRYMYEDIFINKTLTHQIYTTNNYSTLKFVDLILERSLHISRRIRSILAQFLINKQVSKHEAKDALIKIRYIEKMTKAIHQPRSNCVSGLKELAACVLGSIRSGGGAPYGGGSGGSPAAPSGNGLWI